MNRRILAVLTGGCLILGLAVGASTASASGTRNAAALEAVAGCTELKDYLVTAAKRQARRQMAFSARIWGNLLISPPILPAPGMPPAEGGDAPTDHSDTNVQEAGVDEPDLVKTDGDYIYLVNGGYLLVVDSWPAAAMRELARIEIEGDPVGLFVAGDIALVVSNVWEQAALEDGLSFMPAPYSSLTKATLVDLTNRASPATVRELYLEGAYSAARLIDGYAHLVVNNTLPVYVYTGARFQFSAAAPIWTGEARGGIRKFGRALARKNLDDLVPKMEDRRMTAAGVEVETGPISPCEEFYRPALSNGANTVSVVTLDLNAPQAEPRSLTVVTDNGEVYASADNLYIAATRYNGGLFARAPATEGGATMIHKFALGATPEYLASGDVAGWIVNRYAMGEHEGHFRIATTTETWNSSGDDPRNQLYVMAQNGDRLEVISTLEGLGHEGERIYAVRYDGDRGYLVTFRQTDPLYTLDLSDPAAPRVAGELEIPGFSTYLHPIADGYLLAIGQNTELGGGDLSLFDVRDPAAPALVDREWLGEGSWSEAMYEPHAFTYFAPLNQIALPLQQWSYSVVPMLDEEIPPQPEGFNGTVVFDVDPAQGLTKRGMVDHGDPWEWTNSVLRNLYIGDPGNYALYSLSQAALKASNAVTLEDLASIELPGKDGWDGPIVYLAEPAAAP